MIIAVDLSPIRPDGSAGGATGFAIELVKGLSQRSDISILVICADWNVEYLKKELSRNVEYYQINGTRRITGRVEIDAVINRIIRHMPGNKPLEDRKIDLLYCPFSAPTYRTKGVPIVSTILDIQHEYYPQFFTPEELGHRRQFYNAIVKNVERVVCISDYTKETFCEKYGYPIEKASTVYIAIQNRFSNKNDSILERLNIVSGKYIVYPANFWEHKNHKLLLNAFAMFVETTNTDLKLVLTGNPLENTAYYEKLLDSMKIKDKVVITGYISKEELYSVLDNSRGLIYPSLFEGFGIPVVEAMYLYKPIACSNLTSLPEIGCDSIYYFDPKKPDEIAKGIEFLANAEFTDKMKSEYDNKLGEYTAEKMVNSYLEVFEETVASKKEEPESEYIEGIFADGWAGKEINAKLVSREGYELLLKLVNPEFVNFKQTITLTINNKTEKYALLPGEHVELSRIIDSNNENVKIKSAKEWSPSIVLNSDDQRMLGVMVEKIALRNEESTFDLKEMV